MQCPNCGKDNQPGTRFCVHCGTAQPAAVAPVSTVTAAMAQAGTAPGLREAPPRADATSTLRTDATTPLHREGPGAETIVIPRGSPPPATITPVDPAQEAADWLPPPPSPAPASPDAPAYDTAPRGRSGMVIVLGLAALGVLGIAGFFYYQVSSDRQREAELASNAKGATPSAAAGSIVPSTPAAGAAGDDVNATKAGTPVVEAPPADVAPRVDPVPAPADVGASGATSPATSVSPSPPQEPAARSTPAPARPARAAPRTSPPKAEAAPAVVTPAPPPAVKASPPPAPPAAAPRPAPPVDRWAQMNDELARCTRQDFINRVVCDQRARLRYCDGYWGKVTQCPGAPNPDRGQ